MINLTLAEIRAQELFHHHPYVARFVKSGNIKVGGDVYSFSKLAGSTPIESKYGTHTGTCTGCSEGCWDKGNPMKSPCYIAKSYNMYQSVIDSHTRNMIAFKEDIKGSFEELNLQLQRAIKKPVAVRINVAGEIESKEELNLWHKLAAKYPNIPFYLYTKNYKVLDEFMEYMQRQKKTMLKNLWINISIWHNDGIETYRRWRRCNNILAFVYMDGYNYPEDIIPKVLCPAYREENGKVVLNHDTPCSKCKLCFGNKVKTIGCLDH